MMRILDAPEGIDPDTATTLVPWDGKDLAAVQIATFRLPRPFGAPAAQVDRDWDLTVNGMPVAVGQFIAITRDA